MRVTSLKMIEPILHHPKSQKPRGFFQMAAASMKQRKPGRIRDPCCRMGCLHTWEMPVANFDLGTWESTWNNDFIMKTSISTSFPKIARLGEMQEAYFRRSHPCECEGFYGIKRFQSLELRFPLLCVCVHACAHAILFIPQCRQLSFSYICGKHNFFSPQIIGLHKCPQIISANSTVPSGPWESWSSDVSSGIQPGITKFLMIHCEDWRKVKVNVNPVGEYELEQLFQRCWG